MNATQLKYAVGRADEIRRAKIEAITIKHTVPAVKFDADEICKALGNREFKVISKPRSRYLHSIRDFVSFTGERDEVVNQDAIKAETVAIEENHRTILDQLHLGDAEGALKLLSDYEAA